MYTSIDRDNMQFLARSENPTALSYLANIEAAHVSVVILPCDEPRDFFLLTDLELRILVRQTTGSDHSNAHRPSLLATCVSLAQQLPERALNTFELEVQSNCIPDDDKAGRYSYAPGAHKPQRHADLFEPQRLTCVQGWSADRLAEFAKRAPQQAESVAAPSTAPERRSPAARPAAGVPAVPRGAGKVAVWASMDAIWEQAGKPMDVKLVQGLRKRCMDELEAQGFNRSTASCELGNWWKARGSQ